MFDRQPPSVMMCFKNEMHSLFFPTILHKFSVSLNVYIHRDSIASQEVRCKRKPVFELIIFDPLKTPLEYL